jgi:hypothetical protein
MVITFDLGKEIFCNFNALHKSKDQISEAQISARLLAAGAASSMEKETVVLYRRRLAASVQSD